MTRAPTQRTIKPCKGRTSMDLRGLILFGTRLNGHGGLESMHIREHEVLFEEDWLECRISHGEAQMSD